MSPRLIGITTTYKTLVALEKSVVSSSRAADFLHGEGASDYSKPRTHCRKSVKSITMVPHINYLRG